VAGWAVSLCLLIASGLIADLSSGFKGGIDAAFSNVGGIFIGGMVTVVVVTLVVRLRAAQSEPLSLMLFSVAFALFVLIGALAIVLGIIGFFVAFTDSGVSAIVDSLFQHVAGFVLGVTVIIWSIGEAAALGRQHRYRGHRGIGPPPSRRRCGPATATAPAGG
jgi:hypothetical protein